MKKKLFYFSSVVVFMFSFLITTGAYSSESVNTPTLQNLLEQGVANNTSPNTLACLSNGQMTCFSWGVPCDVNNGWYKDARCCSGWKFCAHSEPFYYCGCSTP